LATGFQLFLSRAAIDARWGSFVAHGAYLNPNHKLLREVRKDFEMGLRCGDYKIEVIDAAVHLTIGAMVEGMRHLLEAPRSQAYIQELTAMTLRGMGVPTSQATATARRASAQLDREAGDLFPWWKPFDCTVKANR
jgi:hypothetical protein